MQYRHKTVCRKILTVNIKKTRRWKRDMGCLLWVQDMIMLYRGLRSAVYNVFLYITIIQW